MERRAMSPGYACQVWFRIALLVSAAACGTSASAQLLYSFEPGLEGWGPTGFDGSDLIGVTHSTSGASHGANSMAVERGNAVGDNNAFSWDVNIASVPAGPIYDAFAAVAGDHTKYALDFDVTFTSESFASATHIPPFFGINVSVNSSAAGENNFDQVLNVVPVGGENGNLMDADPFDPTAGVPRLGTHRFSVPLAASVSAGMTGLYLVPNSQYYQLNLGSNLTNSLLTTEPGEGVVYFVDNIRFRRLPDLVTETLFSWDSPDDPGTTTVNEQLEGWTEGFESGHAHSITSTGATHQAFALNIERSYVGPDFTWGSQFELTASETDPTVQQRIDELITKVEEADRVAFDVTFNPATFDASPTYARFFVHFADTENFFQAALPFFNPLSFTQQTTLTMEAPLSAFQNDLEEFLIDVGFAESSTYLRIGLATSVDGLLVEGTPVPIDFQIDNFRLIREVFPLEGDYNDDSAVNAADFVIWRKNVGTENSLPNDPHGGTIGPNQYNAWRDNFGAASGTSALGPDEPTAPEPSALLLVLMAAGCSLPLLRRRHRSANAFCR